MKNVLGKYTLLKLAKVEKESWIGPNHEVNRECF